MKTLYLGLDPSRWPKEVVSYPVIRTTRIESAELDEAVRLWPTFTHVIFTSRSAVQYWFEGATFPSQGKIFVAIGEGTGAALSQFGIQAEIAPTPVQEGVIAWLQAADLTGACLFLPCSKRARPTLTNFLVGRKVPFFRLDLYDTVFQRPEPVPDLRAFDEIVFTSSSTVEGFLRIFGALPFDKKLTAIGAVTAQALSAARVPQ